MKALGCVVLCAILFFLAWHMPVRCIRQEQYDTAKLFSKIIALFYGFDAELGHITNPHLYQNYTIPLPNNITLFISIFHLCIVKKNKN